MKFLCHYHHTLSIPIKLNDDAFVFDLQYDFEMDGSVAIVLATKPHGCFNSEWSSRSARWKYLHCQIVNLDVANPEDLTNRVCGPLLSELQTKMRGIHMPATHSTAAVLAVAVVIVVLSEDVDQLDYELHDRQDLFSFAILHIHVLPDPMPIDFRGSHALHFDSIGKLHSQADT